MGRRFSVIVYIVSPPPRLRLSIWTGSHIKRLDASEADKAIEILTAAGEKASVIGRIIEGEGVTIK